MGVLFEIKQRARQPGLLVPWLKHRLKKLAKKDFNQDLELVDKVPIDVVIPSIPKDYKTLAVAIPALRENICHPINKIFIVSPKNDEITELCRRFGCEFIDENSYLPVRKEVLNFKVGQWNRGGWIFQQLLKFGADSFVTTPNFLILESDTVLLNPVGFMEKGKFVFGNSEEWNFPYFEAFYRLFGFRADFPLSFIAQMMLYNKRLLAECKSDMSAKHNMPWYEAYFAAVDKTELSSIADYENYGQWLYSKHPDLFITRPFYNTALDPKYLQPYEVLKSKYGGKYNSVSFHNYVKG